MNSWAIIDDNGVIEEGPEDEVRATWDEMVAASTSGTVNTHWSGDIKLVEVHGVHR